MTWISCRHVRKSFGDLQVLSDINCDMEYGEKIGLVGRNGAGKSTLVQILNGDLQTDGGTITRQRKAMKVGYLQQSAAQEAGRDAERPGQLSGGERTRLALSRIWAASPEMLILDEPTNHLDFLGVEWLIDELKAFPGTVLIISHDRYFLDRTVSRIVELEDGRSVDYAGNYTFYREEKARRLASQLHQYEERMKTERKIEADIERLRNWSSQAHRASRKEEGFKEYHRKKAKKMDKQIKSRIKRLQKIEFEGAPRPKEEASVRFEWSDEVPKHGRRMIEAAQIGKAYGEKRLFRDSSFFISRGEKVGLLGPNGCGKSTLIRLFLNEETVDSGRLWVSPSLTVGCLTQDVGDLPVHRTVLELLEDEYPIREDIGHARTLLANMGFDEALLFKPIAALSLGERMRVKLALLILQNNDLLILDEPTNHLDLASREQLERALASFGGTLLVVSHDRYFLDQTCESL
ncbi:MAG: transporter ATP-binding protein, partial [Paenibacillaceae bacterium]|nr:transporter ATP-binding protein [Paenibacillaceae bacterium]